MRIEDDVEGFNRQGAERTALCVAAVIAATIVGLGFGRLMIAPADVVAILVSPIMGTMDTFTPQALLTVLNIRLPRVIAALGAGSALALAGASYQGLFKNPMVSPDILGASAGASFGAALGILLSFDNHLIQLMAFALGLTAVMISYTSAVHIGHGGNQTLMLVLCGLIVGTLFQAFVSMIKYTADPDSKLPEITYWLMGSIAKVTKDDLRRFALPYVAGVIPLMLLRWRLNAMSMGDEEAESLGINIKTMRLVYIIASTLLTAAVVSIAGVIGWVGLIIPHVARFLFGPDNRSVLPASFAIGGAFMVLVDTACRSLMASEIPLGILTSVIGAPFFFFILLKTQRGEA